MPFDKSTLGSRRISAFIIVALIICGITFTVGIFSKKPIKDIEALGKFRQRWYSQQLKAMNEPNLGEGGKGCISAYRFIWLRTFHHPVCVRLENRKDGHILLIAKELDGAGGYSPGKLIEDRSIELTLKDFTNFEKQISQYKFWKIPTKQTELTGTDGARWILEGYKGKKYHIVDRWTDPVGPIHKLGKFLMIQTKFLPRDEVY